MKSAKVFYFLIPLLLLALLWHLGSWGVLETSEARYAEISREMLTSGNWFMPRLLGIYHFDKPLMTYWITATGLQFFGTDAFGARFFLQLAYLLQIILVYAITFRLFRQRQKAIYAALFYAGLPLVLMSVRNLTTDAYLNTFELLGVYLLMRYYSRRRPLWLYLFFLDLSLALFTKGPVGLLIPLLMVYPLRKIFHVEGKKNILHMWLGIVIMLVIGSCWFTYLMIKSPEFYHFFIDEQLVDRMFKASTLHRAKPFWYYFVFFPAVTLPAFLLLPEAIGKTFRQKNHPLQLLTIYWFIIPFLFFSASSSKLVLYVLPLSPFVAIAAGWLVDEKPWTALKKYYFLLWGFFALLFIALLILFLVPVSNLTYTPALSGWIFLVAGFVLLVAFLIKNGKTQMVCLSLLFPLIVVPVSTGILKQAEIQVNGTLPLAQFLRSHHLEKRKVIVWDKRLPSLSFNLQKELVSVYYHDFSLKRHTEFQENQNWKKNLINVNIPSEYAYLKKVVAKPSVFLTKKGRLPEQFKSLLQGYRHEKTMGPWEVYY
jgi:4-amino-4-deoxy-L-arabinose transferase-like glycosyltransferase